MLRIIQISDLHFGREVEKSLKAGEKALRSLSPDVIIVAGDLTQRNSRKQYVRMADFFSTLKAKVLIVPGNHDIPLYNIYARFRRPLKRFQEFTKPHHLLRFENSLVSIVGINTIDAAAIKKGKIGKKDLKEVQDVLSGKRAVKWNMLVTHHPLEAIKNSLGFEFLSPIDLWLCGHLHRFRLRRIRSRGMLYSGWQCVSASFISDRLRSEANGFNLLDVCSTKKIKLRNYTLHPAGQEFTLKSEYIISKNL